MKNKFTAYIFVFLTVCISVITTAQSADADKPVERLLHPPPVPNFYITGLCYGDTTFFTNKTDFGTVSWAITNDKGDTLYASDSVNIKYYFKKKGHFNVCLTADNGHTATKIRTVLVDTITHAEFYFRPCINEFDNLSTCSNQFVWTLPDNITSTDIFPKYQFKNGGTFPIKLVAKKGNKANTNIKQVTVPSDSTGMPNSTFTFKRHGTSSTFDLKAVDSLADRYSWTFGDRTFDDTSGYKVTHTFDLDKYNGLVGLRVANGCGFTSYQKDPFGKTGIADDNFLNRNATVYPNPVSNEVNILIQNPKQGKVVDVQLIDVNGAVIQEQITIAMDTSCNFKFNTGILASGIYLIHIRLDDQLLNKKIIVQ